MKPTAFNPDNLALLATTPDGREMLRQGAANLQQKIDDQRRLMAEHQQQVDMIYAALGELAG